MIVASRRWPDWRRNEVGLSNELLFRDYFLLETALSPTRHLDTGLL